MCGIAGFIDYNKRTSEAILANMTKTLAHRGPDGMGLKVWENERSTVGIGHTRLSIIDLSESASQPMHKDNFSIVFNGEIYNFKEVKVELQGLGHTFETQSDTEVVIKAYKQWGAKCIDRFRGMFAFCLVDHTEKKVFLFRDRIGVKPLFLYEKDGLVLFASELKGFHVHPEFDKTLSLNAVSLYFKYGFIPSPQCIFENVVKVKPGHYIIFDLESKASEHVEYWNPNSFLDTSTEMPSGIELENEIEKELKIAFEYRMVADVPVGVFLSGGYDSSLVTAILQKDRSDKINTFTIGFEQADYNEANYAQEVANYLGTNHTSYTCTKSEAQSIIAELPHYYDEPFADSSAIPTFLVSKITAQSVKVALSADGGDELFSGYNRNLRFLDIHNKVNRIPQFVRFFGSKASQMMSEIRASDIDKRLWWNKLASVLEDPSLLNIIDVYPQYLSNDFISGLMKKEALSNINPLQDLKKSLSGVDDQFNALLSFDYQSTLTNDMLVKIDRASMANGLEGREPMLDHKLYEYLSRVPSSQKMHGGHLKFILKNITHKYIPKEIMDRPKKGFGIPINSWLKGELGDLVRAHFSTEAIEKHGILDVAYTQKHVDKLMNNKSNSNNQLWLLLSFQMWCNRWL